MSQQHIEDLAMSLLQRVLDTNQSIREITNIFDKETVKCQRAKFLSNFFQNLALVFF